MLITEKLALDGPYSEDIGPDLLQPKESDEVVLCLNYDGKFGLNNINRFFQNANQSGPAITWYEWTYKKGDRILFNETPFALYVFDECHFHDILIVGRTDVGRDCLLYTSRCV